MTQPERAVRLSRLYSAIEKDPDYRSSRMGSVFVPGSGRIEGRPLVFVGEAPGRDEERKKAPFVGAAGRNLNYLLEAVSLQRADVYITNLVKYRPLGPEGKNRNPTSSESMRALPYLVEEIGILEPSIIVCLGLSSAKALLRTQDLTMQQANGTTFDLNGRTVMVTYHPSPLNFMKPAKRQALIEAFQKLMQILTDIQLRF